MTRSDPPPTVPDGVHDLPPGKIAAIATYLELHVPPSGTSAATPFDGGTLSSLAGDLPRYRSLYARIGEPWLWFSRVRTADAELRAILDHPDVRAMALTGPDGDVGLLELDFRIAGECELAFLGLVPDAVGSGLGRRLVATAIRLAFSRPIRRLWLHTCTLDHPSALPVYLAAGFRPFRRAVEVADDPRLCGQMPRDAAPRFPPLVEP